MKGTILVVEDAQAMREALFDHLSARYRSVHAVATLAEARAVWRNHGIDAAVLDLRLPDGDGLSFLSELHDLSPGLPVVVITAYPEVQAAVSALRGGAADFLQKPFELAELDRVLDRAVLDRIGLDRVPVCVPPCAKHGPSCAGHDTITGESTAVQRLREVIRRGARVPGMPILVEGESGTGKELVARAIHFESPRCRGPFVAFNCASLPAGLAEAEMFGHVRGAFTGAHRDHAGLFEQAHGGTLLLDEVGETPVELQPKLLRAIESLEVRPLGGEAARRVDVRIVAATNRDLEEQVRTGAFRQDLFFRLAVFRIRVPPLRERREDIESLATSLLAEIRGESGLDVRWIERAAMERLAAADWPGNVRELRNALFRAAALCQGATLRDDDVRFVLEAAPREVVAAAGDDSLRARDLAHVVSVFESSGRNKTEAARRLGITRVTLRARLREAGVE